MPKPKTRFRRLKGYKFLSVGEETFDTGYKGLDFDFGILKISPDGIMTIGDSYPWDGVSMGFQTLTNRRASKAHDGGYEILRRIGKLISKAVRKAFRRAIDTLFYKLCIQDKMKKFRAKYCYWAVKTPIAGRSCKPGLQPREKVLTAP